MNKYIKSERFSFENFQSTASIVDLPCIIESQKTLDALNFFKSNDISQMIVVKDEKNDNLKRVATKVEGNLRKYQKKLASDGLTPPTKNIRKRFFRKR